jgi:diguanylate cyclase (GGDEF)-like protein/PAS domain S-box-containing protein
MPGVPIKVKVLVVDDHAANRDVVVSLIEHLGHVALQAADGAEALSVVRAERPQLVISDILMPTMDGYEFVHQLRADPAIASTEVIFYTAYYHEREARHLATACGVSGVLIKPCEPGKILAAIEQALARGPDAVPPPTVREFDQRHLRLITDKLSENVEALQASNQRLEVLTHLNLQLASEQDSGTLLSQVCRGARDLLGTKYAVLAVGARDEGTTRYVATSGMDVDAEGKLGKPEMLEGLVGVAFKNRETCRLVNPGGDPTKVGLPLRHPPVHSALVAPIVSLAHAYGWICLTDKVGADEFNADDEQILTILAAQVGRIYENGSLYAALQESKAGLHRAQVVAKLAHVTTGPQGEFLQWSDTLAPLLGVADPSGLPKDMREWMKLVHHDDEVAFRTALGEAGAGDTRVEVEYRIVRDGHWIHLHQVIEPLPRHDAQRWFNTIQDVTEQFHAAKAVLEAERKYRSIFENSVEGLFQTTPDGQVISANPAAARMLGYGTPEEFIADVHDLARQLYIDPADRRDFIARLQASGEVRAFETRFRRKDGEVIWVSISASSETDLVSNTRYILGSIHDVTERRMQHQRIVHLNRIHMVLSGINTLIVQTRDRGELFLETCRIAVEAGNFPVAWIGMLERDSRGLQVVAARGADAEVFQKFWETLKDGIPEGKSIVARVIRERRPAVANDIEHDPGVFEGPSTLAAGSRSLVALPLIISDQVVGVLVLHAHITGFFDDDELRLLTELADNISLALDHIEKGEKVDYLAFYDPLTGLPNRRLFSEYLSRMLDATSSVNPNVMVGCIDIRRFSMVNESWGREAGDALLRELAARFTATFSHLGACARVGGNSFLAAVPGKWNSAAIARGDETFYPALFGLPFLIAGQQLRIAGTVGVALSPADGSDANTLIGNAEAALRRAKLSGDRMLLYNAEMHAQVADTLAFESKLRLAVERQEFVLHYQPKVVSANRKIVGIEALIRWQSPELGLVPPMKFISLLEETGMIVEVGAWAMRRASLDHRAWCEAGLKPPRVAVNVSAIQLRQTDFVAHVRQAIFEGVTPTGIDLEITESLVMDDIRGNIAKLKEVRGLGVGIAIDDFGTGHSSFAYLAKLPVQTLKIDRSFIITMLMDKDAMTLVQTMISLAHSLRLKVVAEGVDEEGQADVLRGLHCDEMQGYLFSKPLPFDQMAALLFREQRSCPLPVPSVEHEPC